MIMRKDLADIGDKDYDKRRGEFMQCQDCGEEFGGTRGDFFTIHMDYILYCPECGSEKELVMTPYWGAQTRYYTCYFVCSQCSKRR